MQVPMGNNDIDRNRHDSIGFYLAGETYEALEKKCRPGQSVDQLVEELLADEPALVRNVHRIKNRQWHPVVYRQPDPEVFRQGPVMCSCCPGTTCRFPFTWRGRNRCGCNEDRIASLTS